MPFVNGRFSLLRNWNVERANNENIYAARFDEQDEDIRDALSEAVLKDGTQTISADLPFSNKRITGHGTASAATDLMSRDAADARYMTGSNLTLTGTTLPATPASGVGVAWYKSADDTFHFLNDAGTDITVAKHAKLISSGAAALVSSIDFTLADDFQFFVLSLTEIEPTATAGPDLWIRLSFDNGATYKSGASDYSWVDDDVGVLAGFGSAEAIDFDSADSEFEVLPAGQEEAAGRGATLSFTLATRVSGSHYATARWRRSYIDDTDQFWCTGRSGGVCRASNTRPTNIRLLYSSGNISYCRYTLSGWGY